MPRRNGPRASDKGRARNPLVGPWLFGRRRRQDVFDEASGLVEDGLCGDVFLDVAVEDALGRDAHVVRDVLCDVVEDLLIACNVDQAVQVPVSFAQRWVRVWRAADRLAQRKFQCCPAEGNARRVVAEEPAPCCFCEVRPGVLEAGHFDWWNREKMNAVAGSAQCDGQA